PSAIAARLVYSSAPESMQGAIAAGLLSVGSVLAGTVEGCGALLARMVASPERALEAERIVEEYKSTKRTLPGFGHPQHKPDDPRTPALFAVAEAHGLVGEHIICIRLLSSTIDREYGKHLTINATGAIAACLADCGVRPQGMRGFSVLARC